MATRNIVPRADTEGAIGTSAKRWGDARFVTMTLDKITLSAGTTSVAPINFTAGTNLTSATAGANEYDGKVFYTTPVTGARGLSPSTMFSLIANSNFSLATTSGVQSAFSSSGDVWTVAANTAYFVEGTYIITKTTTSVTTAIAFPITTGSYTDVKLFVMAANAAADTTVTASNFTWLDTSNSTVVTAATTGAVVIRFRGIIKVNAAGTITPQINFSANTTVPVMVGGSYITFTPLGSDTATVLGNVA